MLDIMTALSLCTHHRSRSSGDPEGDEQYASLVLKHTAKLLQQQEIVRSRGLIALVQEQCYIKCSKIQEVTVCS